MNWRTALTGRPFALLALAALVGVVLSDRSSASAWQVTAWVSLGIVAGWLACRTARWRWLVVLAVSVFAERHAVELRNTRYHPLRSALDSRLRSLPVEVHGHVRATLRGDLPGGEAGEAFFVADEVRCPVTGEVWSGPVALRLFTSDQASPPPGEYRVVGRLRLPSAPDNPGQFDGRSYRLRLGVVADLSASRIERLRLDSWSVVGALSDAAEACRSWVARTLSLDLEDAPKERAIILAMALGTIDAENKDLERPFRDSGTLHIFAVSGLHVTMVGAIFWALLRPFGFRRGVLVVSLAALLFGYAFVTGLRPSAIRAAVMASVILIGVGLHRRPDLLNSLGAAALLIIAWDSQQVFAPGFQLSFGVMVAIALFAEFFIRPLQAWVEPDPFLPRQLLSARQKFAWTARREVTGIFAVSASAALGSLPLVFGYFHLVTPVSLLANAVLVPLSFLVLGTAILTLVCGALHLTFVQVLFSNANLAFAAGAFHAAEFFAGIPGGNFHVAEPSFVARPPAEITILRLPAGAAAQHLRVDNRHWLLDTGTDLNFGLIVQPYLEFKGVYRLDGLVLSHSDYEHIGATFRVLRDLGAPPVWEPAREPWRWETGSSSFRAFHKRGLVASPLAQGDVRELGSSASVPTRATTLYPTAGGWPRRSDDRTLVLRLDLGAFRVLWCNDAGFLAEKAMLETLPSDSLRSDVIIRNQHADDFSLLPEFLDVVRPRIVITSNDTFPPEQALPQRVRDECAKRNVTLLDQRETGAVTLGIWSDHVDVQSVHQGSLQALYRTATTH